MSRQKADELFPLLVKIFFIVNFDEKLTISNHLFIKYNLHKILLILSYSSKQLTQTLYIHLVLQTFKFTQKIAKNIYLQMINHFYKNFILSCVLHEMNFLFLFIMTPICTIREMAHKTENSSHFICLHKTPVN